MRDNGLKYDFIGEFSKDGLAAICGKSKKWGLINSSGEEVLLAGCYIDYFWDGFAAVQKGGSALAVIENEKYCDGRHDFVLVLWENRLDIPFIQIFQNRSDFWEKPRFASTIIRGLVRRKIAGFAPQIQAALQ